MVGVIPGPEQERHNKRPESDQTWKGIGPDLARPGPHQDQMLTRPVPDTARLEPDLEINLTSSGQGLIPISRDLKQTRTRPEPDLD